MATFTSIPCLDCNEIQSRSALMTFPWNIEVSVGIVLTHSQLRPIRYFRIRHNVHVNRGSDSLFNICIAAKCDSNEDRRIFTYSSFHFIIFSPGSRYDFFLYFFSWWKLSKQVFPDNLAFFYYFSWDLHIVYSKINECRINDKFITNASGNLVLGLAMWSSTEPLVH